MKLSNAVLPLAMTFALTGANDAKAQIWGDSPPVPGRGPCFETRTEGGSTRPMYNEVAVEFQQTGASPVRYYAMTFAQAVCSTSITTNTTALAHREITRADALSNTSGNPRRVPFMVAKAEFKPVTLFAEPSGAVLTSYIARIATPVADLLEDILRLRLNLPAKAPYPPQQLASQQYNND